LCGDSFSLWQAKNNYLDASLCCSFPDGSVLEDHEMLEVSLWHQGLIAWQLTLIEATLPVVKFMLFIMGPLQEGRKAESIDPAFFIFSDY
jgi:hypothetical protein